MRVTVRALSHLDDLVTEQDRRRFSRPRHYRTKVSKCRSQLLQHLVCCVAEFPETRQRRVDRTTPKIADDLLIRFIVDLSRYATRRSSFYVNLGISRILHDYSTAEARAINDFLTQDPKRMRDDAYFRYGKGLLFREMRQRFGSLIETTRKARGELRFRSRRPSPRQAALVDECLRLLTPWKTRCPLPESFHPQQEELPSLCFTGGHPDDEHPVDLRRMHTVLHPRCYSKVTRVIGLDTPTQRLMIPRFFTGPDGCDSEARSDVTTAYRRPRALSQDETTAIDAELRTIARRRQRWTLRALSI